MILVKFLVPFGPYNRGDVAGFGDERGEELLNTRVFGAHTGQLCELVERRKDPDPQEAIDKALESRAPKKVRK